MASKYMWNLDSFHKGFHTCKSMQLIIEVLSLTLDDKTLRKSFIKTQSKSLSKLQSCSCAATR